MIIVQAPLRTSLFGGGTDFPGYYLEHGGCVLTSWFCPSLPRSAKLYRTPNRRGMTRAAAARSPFRSGAYCVST